jgi:hypothetical protein
VEIVCLANSAKHGGRCLAGINLDSGRWVRPVSDQQEGQLRPSAMKISVGGVIREVGPLDVIDLGPIRARPEVGQPENVVFESGIASIGFRHSISINQLGRFIQREGNLLFGDLPYVPKARALDVRSSLALIEVNEPRFWISPNKPNQLRVCFDFAKVQYDLPVTDTAPWTVLAKRDPASAGDGRWLFTVSLGVPYYGKLYKLVACGMRW